MQDGPSNSINQAEFEMFEDVLEDNITDFVAYLHQENITELNWSGKGIDFKSAKKLAKVLISGAPLTTLYLANNSIGSKGTMVLAEVLAGSKIKCLDLSGNHINDKGAIALASAISKRGSPVLFLKLNNNAISPVGAHALTEALSSSPIQSLYLEHNMIGRDGCVQLINTLSRTQLKSLQLKENNWDPQLADQPVYSMTLWSQHHGFYIREVDLFELVGNGLRSSDVFNLGFLPKYKIPDNGYVGFDYEHYNNMRNRFIKLCRSERKFEEVLKEQQIRLSFVPYIALCMTQVSPMQKVRYLNISHVKTVDIPGRGQVSYTFSDSDDEYQIRYAFGILMNLPMEIVHKIVNYLPCMQHPKQLTSFEQIDRYFEIIRNYHSDGIVLKDAIAASDDSSEESKEKQKEEVDSILAITPSNAVPEILIEKPKAVMHSYNLRDRKRHGSQDKVDSQQFVKKRKTMNE